MTSTGPACEYFTCGNWKYRIEIIQASDKSALEPVIFTGIAADQMLLAS